MPIVWAEAGSVDTLRGRILEELAEKKRENPGYRVIDVGGVYKPWADSVVDAYVDLQSTETEKDLHIGNICEPEVWEQIRASGKKYDFVICTHVLEDVRDPLFVARQLSTIARAGFVSVPTKHTEMSNVESTYYLGYCHHRWLFTARSDAGQMEMLALAKFPVVGYFNSKRRPLLKIWHLFGKPFLFEKAQRRLGVFPAGPGIDWVDRGLVGHDKELAVRWEGDLPLRILNDDFSGLTCLDAANLYRHSLGEGA